VDISRSGHILGNFRSNPAFYTDLLSVFKDSWAKIGVNLLLQPRDPGAFTSIASGKKHENAYFYTCHTALMFNMDSWRNPDLMQWNGAIVRDSYSLDFNLLPNYITG
jgi:hypothetical protein